MTHNLQTNIIIGGHVAASLHAAFGMVNSQAASTAASMGKIGKIGALVGAGFKTVATVATVGLTAAATAATVLGQKGIQLASDLQEVQNVVDTTFGKNSPINSWAQTALKNFGLTELQAKQFTGTMGAMLKSSGITGKNLEYMSSSLAGLSGDFSSFYNISQDDAFQKIRAGISGETEPLKQIGINMSVANLNAYTLSKGLKVSYDKMNQASQAALRYSYLMSVSKDAQGDFNKTQGSFANQTRILKANFDQLLAKIAVGFLPVVTKGVNMMNKLLDSFSGNTAAISGIQSTVSSAIQTVRGFIPILMDLGYKTLPYLRNSFNAIAPVVQTLINKLFIPLAPVIMNIIQAVNPLATTIITTLRPAVEMIIDVFWKLMDVVLPPTIAVINKLKDLFIALAPTVNWVVGVIGSAWDGLRDTFGPIISNIMGLLGGIIDFLTGVFTLNWKKAWSGIKDVISNLFKGIGNIILSPLNYMFSTVNGLIDGINKIKVPLIGSLNIPKLPILTLAKGATVTAPTFALIGEAGVPETAIPHTNTPRSKALLKEAAAGVGVSMGNNIEFTFAPVIYGDASKDALEDLFEQFKTWAQENIVTARRESYGI